MNYLIILAIIIVLIILSIWRYTRRPGKKDDNLFRKMIGHKPYNSPELYDIYANKFIDNINSNTQENYQREEIPKKIFRLWCNKGGEGSCGGRIAEKKVLEITQKNMPGWEQIIYGKKEQQEFVEKEYGKNHYITKAYELINPKYGASRADLIRLLLIYKYGGLYLDMKSCVKKPLPPLPKDKDLWVSNWDVWGAKAQSHLFENGEYQNWFIYGRKNAPIIKDIIDKVVSNIYELYNNYDCYLKYLTINETLTKGTILATTGPIALTMVIKNSKNKDTVYVNNLINASLQYNCQKDTNFSKSHYSMLSEPVVTPRKDIIHIPKVVYFTYHDIKDIPEKVIDNIYYYCKGYEINIYTDEMCEDFLKKYYGDIAVSIFKNMSQGAHKADFWRYCVLYLNGGYYFDIKTDFRKNISSIFNDNSPNTWYSVIDKSKKSIYNGIIATPPNNPIIFEAIKYVYKNPDPVFYSAYIRKLYDLLKCNCVSSSVQVGINYQKNDWKCILFEEKCEDCDKSDEDCDRYGYKCKIYDKDGDCLFNTRYPYYPFKKI